MKKNVRALKWNLICITYVFFLFVTATQIKIEVKNAQEVNKTNATKAYSATSCTKEINSEQKIQSTEGKCLSENEKMEIK